MEREKRGQEGCKDRQYLVKGEGTEKRGEGEGMSIGFKLD